MDRGGFRGAAGAVTSTDERGGRCRHHQLREPDAVGKPASTGLCRRRRHRVRRARNHTVKIAVLGAGVVGITSAHYLAKAGHEVTVVDRQPGPALETSFANAGELSPGYASPWAAPGIPTTALRWRSGAR